MSQIHSDAINVIAGACQSVCLFISRLLGPSIVAAKVANLSN